MRRLMAQADKLYDLMLLLNPEVDDERRDAILATARGIIERGGGTVEGEYDWGLRPLTFEIGHRPDGEYYLFQFTGEPEVLEDLHHTLRITDGLMRFRIIAVRPGTPPPPEVRQPATAEA
jgi:small subunit ribosomal protein S6